MNAKQAKRLRQKIRLAAAMKDPDGYYRRTKHTMVKGRVLLDKHLEFQGRK